MPRCKTPTTPVVQTTSGSSNRLTQAQITHFAARTTSIIDQRVQEAIKDLGPTPKPPKEYSNEEKYELIRTRKAKLKPLETIGNYCYLWNTYEYPPRPDEAKLCAEHKKYNAAVAKLVAEGEEAKTRALDELHAGGAQSVLALLAKLETLTF